MNEKYSRTPPNDVSQPSSIAWAVESCPDCRRICGEIDKSSLTARAARFVDVYSRRRRGEVTSREKVCERSRVQYEAPLVRACAAYGIIFIQSMPQIPHCKRRPMEFEGLPLEDHIERLGEVLYLNTTQGYLRVR